MRKFLLHSRFYYSKLAAEDQKIYRQIYDGWCTGSCKARIRMPGKGFETPCGTQLHRIVEWILHDNPHLFHLETTQISYRRWGPEVMVRAEQIYTPEEYSRIYHKLTVRVDQILEKARACPTPFEKVRFLHDYLADNITYHLGGSDTRSAREVHTIVGALLNSACVCDGYARAFRLLCDLVGVSCIVVVGESLHGEDTGGHAWNIVKIDGKCYHMDVTWDSGLGYPFYFMRSDAFFALDHEWDRTVLPISPSDSPGQIPTQESKWELERYVCERVRRGELSMMVRLAASFPDADALPPLVEKIVQRNPLVFSGISSYSFLFYDKIKYAKLVFTTRGDACDRQ